METWSLQQICTYIANKLMHEPSMFGRHEVCSYVRKMARKDEVLQRHTQTSKPDLFMYEWDTPLGVKRELTYRLYNGKEPDRTVALIIVPPNSGCNQALLAPPVGSDGSLRDSQWFDVQRLEVQEGERITLDNGTTPGCDRAAPRR